MQNAPQPAEQHSKSWCQKKSQSPPESRPYNLHVFCVIRYWRNGLHSNLTGRAALDELVPKAKARALPKCLATFRGPDQIAPLFLLLQKCLCQGRRPLET